MGCMSFTLDEIFERRGPWPEWFWLLPQTSGIFGHEHIERQVVDDSQAPGMKEHMVVSGRVRANMMVGWVCCCPGPAPPLAARPSWQ